MARSMLKPRGVLYVMDDYPFVGLLEERVDAPEGIGIGHGYFDRRPHHFEAAPSYVTDPAAPGRTAGETVEWAHAVGDFIAAVVGAGLRVEFLHGHPLSTYRRFTAMVAGEDGTWRLPEGLRDKVPLLMSLSAVAE